MYSRLSLSFSFRFLAALFRILRFLNTNVQLGFSDDSPSAIFVYETNATLIIGR